MLRDYYRRVVDGLSIAVLVLDRRLRLLFMNAAAETLFESSFRKAHKLSLSELIVGAEPFIAGLRHCLESGHPYIERELQLALPPERTVTVDCTAVPLLERDPPTELLLELRQVDWRLRISREEHILAQHHTTRALIRNLAHEIKNPLGGIRGSAQLLQRELGDAQLREFTAVIIAEADRLNELMSRLLSSHCMMRPAPLNIHDVLERVRRLILAEFPALDIRGDYDLSLPELSADREQLIQAILNIVRNAAQAVEGAGEILLRTRVARQVTLAKRRYKLALELQVIDNGPGIATHIREQIFYPLVSGRAGGSGLGLSLAQGFIKQHQGMIEVDSRPGRTCFTILLPISDRV